MLHLPSRCAIRLGWDDPAPVPVEKRELSDSIG